MKWNKDTDETMAKKNLHSLMSGIIGSEPNNEQTTAASIPQPSNPSVQRGPGRPKKSEDNDDTRATFIISAELLRKIKYISLMEDTLQKDVVGEALSLYVSKWEHDNGPIRLPKK